MSRKIRKSGVQLPNLEGKTNFPFSFYFPILHTKLHGVLYGEFENEKKKNKFFFDLPELGFEPQIFSNFCALDLNLRVTRSNPGKLLKDIGLYAKTLLA